VQVYYNLTEHEQAVFDEFESDDYEKCLVDAIFMVRGMSLFAIRGAKLFVQEGAIVTSLLCLVPKEV
jgi:hypothetical protein